MAACPVQSLVAARNMVVQRLRAITDERRRLMAALHSFVLQVGATASTSARACNRAYVQAPTLAGLQFAAAPTNLYMQPAH